MDLQLKSMELTLGGQICMVLGQLGDESLSPSTFTFGLVPEKNVGLNPAEKMMLTYLLKKSVNKDFMGEVWHALIQKFPTVPLELIVLDDENRVLLADRDDPEFGKCKHHPGSVWNDWEKIHERLLKLVSSEIMKGAGIQITTPEPIGWMGVYRGDGPYDNVSRNACSLIYIARLVGKFVPKKGYGFYDFKALPTDLLGCHQGILLRVQKYLETGEYIFG